MAVVTIVDMQIVDPFGKWSEIPRFIIPITTASFPAKIIEEQHDKLIALTDRVFSLLRRATMNERISCS